MSFIQEYASLQGRLNCVCYLKYHYILSLSVSLFIYLSTSLSFFLSLSFSLFLSLCTLATAQQEAEFPLVKQCRNDNKGPSLNTRSINFCMELGGGLLPKFPQAVCPDPNDILVITGYDLLSAKSWAESCHHSDLDGFTHYPAVNSSCLRQYGYSQHVKETILPLIKMYSGKTMAQMEDVNRNQYARLRATGSPDLSVHTWLGLFSKCVQSE